MTAICVFAKPPRPGEAKTRLAGLLGDAHAARLARAFFDDTWTKASSLPWAATVLATTRPDDEAWSAMPPGDRWMQGDGNLGRRIARILRRALDTHEAAIAIGADAPALSPSDLERAHAALHTHDAVIGPTEDGGFYLLGLRRCPAELESLLEGIPWSTEATCGQMRAALARLGFTVAEVPASFDVDCPEDLDRLRRMRGDLTDLAPETAKALAPRVSVIVPTLDEEDRIPRQLAHLAAAPDLHETIVVDGGSRDRTAALVRASGTARLVCTPPGRGSQMNAGASAATGDALLFLHADVVLPPGAGTLIADTLLDSAIVGGAFRIRTVPDGGSGWPARLLWLADLRSRYSALPYGDQGLFVRKAMFDAIGGYAPIPLFEDLDFSRRLRKAGGVRILREQVLVSGRRFMARPVYSALIMSALPVLYRVGVPPATLARLYGHVR